MTVKFKIDKVQGTSEKGAAIYGVVTEGTLRPKMAIEGVYGLMRAEIIYQAPDADVQQDFSSMFTPLMAVTADQGRVALALRGKADGSLIFAGAEVSFVERDLMPGESDLTGDILHFTHTLRKNNRKVKTILMVVALVGFAIYYTFR